MKQSLQAVTFMTLVSINCCLPVYASDDPEANFHRVSDLCIMVARSRKQNGLAMLAYHLEFRANTDLGLPVNYDNVVWMQAQSKRIRQNIEEFLTIYPQLSAENQRQLANQMLELSSKLMAGRALAALNKHYYGRHEEYFPPPPVVQDPELGNKLITCVLDSAEKNRYPASLQMVNDFRALSQIPGLSPANKAKISKIGDFLLQSKSSSIDHLVTDMESLVPHEWPLSKTPYQKPVPWKKFELSYQKYRPKETSKTPPAERRGPIATYMTMYELPAESTTRLKNDLSALLPLYLALPESDQHDICGRIGSVIEKMLYTNLNAEADNFYWKFLPTVKVGWLDIIHSSTGVFLPWSYYENAYDLEKAKAIMTKHIAFENVSTLGDQNKYRILGDIYNMLHQMTEAREQYLIAQQLNEESFKESPTEQACYKMSKEENDLRLEH